MRIAWRYSNLDKIDSVQGGSNIGHYFDLSQHIDQDTITNLDITYFPNGKNLTKSNRNCAPFTNSIYGYVLNDLSQKIKSERFSIKANVDTSTEKNILRVVFKAIGSPLWWSDNFADDFCRFLITLRALVRNSMTTCCLTVPSHLFQHFVSKHIEYEDSNASQFSVHFYCIINNLYVLINFRMKILYIV